jgi:predicted PurR-regulated permease PerM
VGLLFKALGDWDEPGPARFSYLFMIATLVLTGVFHLGTALVVTLFAYLTLTRLHFFKRSGKWVAVGVFLLVVFSGAYGLGYFIRHTVRDLPEIADKAIPSVIQLAREYHIELPFTDYESLMDLVRDTVKSQTNYLASVARVARGATNQFVFLLVGCVVAISLFLHPHFESGPRRPVAEENLYTACCTQIAARFGLLYRSFATVMGAQVFISAINTVLTAIFALSVRLPYTVVVLGVTFLCGLVPVVGNVISNTIIVAIGLTVSPRLALAALLFLVVIHKLEYFLNSKIVGWRIRNPLWLTLLALVVGEKLMGLPGMILAPVLLNYVRLEASGIQVDGEVHERIDAPALGEAIGEQKR